MTFSLHRVRWTPEKARRFWDCISSSPTAKDQYFGRMVGESLLKRVLALGIPVDRRILDYGCGPGYFLEILLRRGIACEGCDFSSRSAIEAERRLRPNDKFRGVHHVTGVPTPFETHSFGTVFFLETIEHLLAEDLDPTLAELHRILSPGGILIVTTPNEEDIEAQEVVCPDCGAVYHRMQHQRSWDRTTLCRTLEKRGFETIECRPLYFTQPSWASRLKAAWYRTSGKKLPHLFYYGVASRNVGESSYHSGASSSTKRPQSESGGIHSVLSESGDY